MTLNLPENMGPDRENAILVYVEAANFEVTWGTITSDWNGHSAEFYVFADALKIEGVRVNVSAQTAQKIADSLDCMLLTPKLADMIWQQREVSLFPFPRGNINGMSTTTAMIEHSSKIDAALAKMSNPYGLMCTVGKHWVVDNDLLLRPKFAMNYGWHFDGSTFQGQGFEITATHIQNADGRLVRLIQGKGTRHDMFHVDYSQVCVLVSQNCKVDGVEMRLSDVMVDPVLSNLANMGGVLKVLRQPGV